MKAPMSKRVRELLTESEESRGYLLGLVHKARLKQQEEFKRGWRRALETDTEKITKAMR